jgi:caffeoyl-CoA O-methyltransferase
MAKRRGKPPRIPQLGNHGLDDALHAYATSLSSPEPPGLEALRRATWTQTVKPQMLCDELQGRLLAALSHMIAPTRVLELGTFTGYATACWAEGLAEGGMVDTVDVNDELHAVQDRHWETLGWTTSIRRHTGSALQVLESGSLFDLDSRPFDVVFVDADKEHQRTYVDWAIEHVRDGGWIVVDNVLWWGEVLRVMEGTSVDPYAVQIHELNEHMKGHPELDNVLLPLRDGLHIARRKARS